MAVVFFVQPVKSSVVYDHAGCCGRPLELWMVAVTIHLIGTPLRGG
ncbi:MAG: hypothetical protein QXM16_00550 [Nitrososphaerota archaeon]